MKTNKIYTRFFHGVWRIEYRNKMVGPKDSVSTQKPKYFCNGMTSMSCKKRLRRYWKNIPWEYDEV